MAENRSEKKVNKKASHDLASKQKKDVEESATVLSAAEQEKLFKNYTRFHAEKYRKAVSGDQASATEDVELLVTLIGLASLEQSKKTEPENAANDEVNQSPAEEEHKKQPLMELVAARTIHPNHFDYQKMVNATQIVGATSFVLDLRGFAKFLCHPQVEPILRKFIISCTGLPLQESGTHDEKWWAVMSKLTQIDLRLALQQRAKTECNLSDIPLWVNVRDSNELGSGGCFIELIQREASGNACRRIIEAVLVYVGLHKLSPLNKANVELMLNSCECRGLMAGAVDVILAEYEGIRCAKEEERIAKHHARMKDALAEQEQRKIAKRHAEEEEQKKYEERIMQRKVSHRVLAKAEHRANRQQEGNTSATKAPTTMDELLEDEKRRDANNHRSPPHLRGINGDLMLKSPLGVYKEKAPEPTAAELVEHPIHDAAFGRRLDVYTPAEDRQHRDILKRFIPRTASDVSKLGKESNLPPQHSPAPTDGIVMIEPLSQSHTNVSAKGQQQKQPMKKFTPSEQEMSKTYITVGPTGRSVSKKNKLTPNIATEGKPKKKRSGSNTSSSQPPPAKIKDDVERLRGIVSSTAPGAAMKELLRGGFLAPIQHNAAEKRLKAHDNDAHELLREQAKSALSLHNSRDVNDVSPSPAPSHNKTLEPLKKAPSTVTPSTKKKSQSTAAKPYTLAPLKKSPVKKNPSPTAGKPPLTKPTNNPATQLSPAEALLRSGYDPNAAEVQLWRQRRDDALREAAKASRKQKDNELDEFVRVQAALARERDLDVNTTTARCL